MRLLDLEPTFIRLLSTKPSQSHIEVDALDQAHGVAFLCPKCFLANSGPIGTHKVICWSKSRGVSDDVVPKPGRWVLSGTELQDLTLDAEPGGSRSVSLTGGCHWHGYITNGLVTNA